MKRKIDGAPITEGKQAVRATVRRLVVTALSLAIVASLAPAICSALTTEKTTIRGNATTGDDVIGGVETRITWEGIIEEADLTKLVFTFPEGSSFTDDSYVNLTHLIELDRYDVDASVAFDERANTISIDFKTPLSVGDRLRVEMYYVALPKEGGDYTLHMNGELAGGTAVDYGESASMSIVGSSLSERIVNKLDSAKWCEAWNSVLFLKLFLKPQLIVSSIPTVFIGWLLSLMLVCIGFPLAIPIGLLFAFAKISRFRILRGIAAIYTGIIRGTPLFLQIYLAFFGLGVLHISYNQYVLAILVLAFNSGAYLTEIFRAGIQSIHKGQFEAAYSLGMTPFQTMLYVIIPQTVRRVIPTMTSEFILLYKDTSLLAAVGVMELMLYSKSIVAVTGNMTPYIVAACFYLIVTLPLIKIVTKAENRLARADGASPTDPRAEKKAARKAEKKAARKAAKQAQGIAEFIGVSVGSTADELIATDDEQADIAETQVRVKAVQAKRDARRSAAAGRDDDGGREPRV